MSNISFYLHFLESKKVKVNKVNKAKKYLRFFTFGFRLASP